jgi:hypothetical protein
MGRSAVRRIRQNRIISELETKPPSYRRRDSRDLGVSVSTVRLDRAFWNTRGQGKNEVDGQARPVPDAFLKLEEVIGGSS